MRKKPHSKQTFRLDIELAKLLEERAHARGVSRTEVVEAALMSLLQSDQDERMEAALARRLAISRRSSTAWPCVDHSPDAEAPPSLSMGDNRARHPSETEWRSPVAGRPARRASWALRPPGWRSPRRSCRS